MLYHGGLVGQDHMHSAQLISEQKQGGRPCKAPAVPGMSLL